MIGAMATLARWEVRRSPRCAAHVATLVVVLSATACGSSSPEPSVRDAAADTDTGVVTTPPTDLATSDQGPTLKLDTATSSQDATGATGDAAAPDVPLGSDGLVTEHDAPASSLDGPAAAADAFLPDISVGDGGGMANQDAATSTGDAPVTAKDAASPDASGCMPIPISDLLVSASAASGTIVGGDLNAVLCPGGASAYIESAGARYDTVPYFLLINWTLGSSTSADFDFLSPAGASNGELSLMVGLSSASPGDYSSPTGQDCGSMAFTYYLPVPPGVNCDGGSGMSCPAGCSTVCAGSYCMPCTPQQPSVSYTAQGTTDCMGNSQAPIGSWQFSLTSVTPGDAGTGSGLTYFTPHGSFTAAMMADDGSSGTATLSVTF
jgi:hypothetical protein